MVRQFCLSADLLGDRISPPKQKKTRGAMRILTVRTRNRTDFVDVTRDVAVAVTELGIADGVVTVFVPHTTCGVTIKDTKLLTPSL